MANVLIVYAHPEPASFNAALKNRAIEALTAAGHRVVVSDLYAEGFNPVAGRHDFTTIADASRFHYQKEQGHAAREAGYASDIAREQALFHAQGGPSVGARPLAQLDLPFDAPRKKAEPAPAKKTRSSSASSDEAREARRR